jgi:alkylation response protein AidB-like acyl-CoA dehydrogenase
VTLLEVLGPSELGGGGLSHAELGQVLRTIGSACGSTALAFSMHTHQVAIAAWRWRNDRAPLEPLLRRVADERIVLISSGGSDWVQSSGIATRVDGGYRINAHKAFASGSPAGDLLLTRAVTEESDGRETSWCER